MKPLAPLIAFILLQASADAAITVTISPGTEGTRFSITQTSDNPVFPTDAVTGGLIGGILLASGSISQTGSFYGFSGDFDSPAGTLSDIAGDGSSLVAGLYFVFSTLTDRFHPVLDLDPFLAIEPNQTHQLLFTSGTGGETAIPFDSFVPGTYMESDVLFGEITTIVIPEPTTALLALVAPLCLTRRRR